VDGARLEASPPGFFVSGGYVRPIQVLVEAASDDLRRAGSELRRAGWEVDLRVDAILVPEEDAFDYTVSLVVRLPRPRIPIEAVR
jgi:hypothetical protein